MNTDELWIGMSWAWCDTNLDDQELKKIALKIDASKRDYLKLFFHVYFLIIPSWSIDSFFAVPSAGLNLPWEGWDPESMLEKKRVWCSYGLLYMLFPLCCLGLPVSIYLGTGYFIRLFGFIQQNA